MSRFFKNKVGNAHRKLLAHLSLPHLQIERNGEVDLRNFLWYKKRKNIVKT